MGKGLRVPAVFPLLQPPARGPAWVCGDLSFTRGKLLPPPRLFATRDAPGLVGTREFPKGIAPLAARRLLPSRLRYRQEF